MNTGSPVVGVLALQGDYQKHRAVLDSISVPSVAVRRPEDFLNIDRLIIPGGESTVMVELLKRLNLQGRFAEFIRSRPVWGTCAGMIILADRINDSSLTPYRVIDIAVDRNGYGRQIASTVRAAQLCLNGTAHQLDLVFIRAPRVTAVGNNVKVLLAHNDDPVLLTQDNILVSSFHPELTGSTILHNYFARQFVTY